MSRRLSYGDEEDIIVKPSTELIADEYEHSEETTNNIAVHTFASQSIKDQDNVNLFIETLNKNGYQIKPENAHSLVNDNFEDILKEISDHTETLGGLILFFSGFCKSEGKLDMFDGKNIVSVRIQEVWNKFTSYICPGLKDRPKIFIFHVTSPTTIETDGRKLSSTYALAYETPAEADLLIVYNKTESNYQRDFTDQLCDNVNSYGKTEDIISLVTCTDSILFETRPMIISTLTRKFYFTVSESRGYYLSIDENHEQFVRDLNEVDEKLSQVNGNLEKKKKFFSFNLGTKNSIKKDVLKEEASEDKEEYLNRYSNNRESNIKKTSGANPKSSTVSQTESDGGKSNLRRTSKGPKPNWKFAFKK